MRISITKCQPKNAKHFVRRRPTDYAVVVRGVGSSSRDMTNGPEIVNFIAYASDGEDESASTRIAVAFTLNDDPDLIDSLIGRLTDLRAAQRAGKGVR